MSHKATHWAWSVRDVSSSEKLVLLALADRHNADTGDCFPSLDRIAEDTCTSRDTARRATQSLEQKGLVSRILVTDLQGRTLGYRYTLHMGDSTVLRGGLQDATPEGGTVLPKPVKETGKEKPISRSLALAEFDEFWKGYPRKVGKLAAEKAYVKARRSTDHASIMATLGSYKFSDDPQFIPHPATWLNRGSFLDEAAPGHTVGNVPRPNTDDPFVLYEWFNNRGYPLAAEEYDEYDRCHDAFMRRKAIEGWK